MKRNPTRPSRGNVLANLWAQHGCPETMTIHVKSTGEMIVLRDGLPVVEGPLERCSRRPSGTVEGSRLGDSVSAVPPHLTLCEACNIKIPPGQKSKRFCSARCRGRAKEERRRQRRSARAGEMLAAAVGAAMWA